MNRHRVEGPSVAGMVLGALALGALAMYLLDPQQGNRRRAVVRDKLYSVSRKSKLRAQAKSRDLANRAKGVVYEARRAAGKVAPIGRALTGSGTTGNR